MLRNAAKAGVSLVEFWQLTPYELFLLFDVFEERTQIEMDNQVSLSYLGANLQRVKTMPKLEKLLSKTKAAKKDVNNTAPKEKAGDETARRMLNTIKGLNAAFGGKGGE